MSNCPELSPPPPAPPAQLGVIVETFAFSERRKSVLIKLYPALIDKPAFGAVLDEVLGLPTDRRDVLRQLQLS